ncbi:MAG: DUF503 domain-containing protein [Candidatus Anammoxibacter sp.]
MIVGILSVRLVMRQSRSVKDKRRIIKNLTERIRNTFNVSAAETSMMDNKQSGMIGISMAGSNRRAVNRTLLNVVTFFDTYPNAKLIDYQLEFI